MIHYIVIVPVMVSRSGIRVFPWDCPRVHPSRNTHSTMLQCHAVYSVATRIRVLPCMVSCHTIIICMLFRVKPPGQGGFTIQ